MSKAKSLLASLAFFLSLTVPAFATVPSMPYVFTPNTTIVSAQVNANFNTLVIALTGSLDSTNISLARGIGANYIVSSGAGNTGSFQAGQYTFTSGTVGMVPLTVACISGQTADCLDVNLNGAKTFYIDASGNAHVNGHGNQLSEPAYITSSISGQLSAYTSGACPPPSTSCTPAMPVVYNLNSVTMPVNAMAFSCGSAGSGTTTVVPQYATGLVDPYAAGTAWTTLSGFSLSFTTAQGAPFGSNIFTTVDLNTLGATWIRFEVTAVSTAPSACFFHLSFLNTGQ